MCSMVAWQICHSEALRESANLEDGSMAEFTTPAEEAPLFHQNFVAKSLMEGSTFRHEEV